MARLRDKLIQIFVTDYERQLIMQASELTGLPYSVWSRNVLLQASVSLMAGRGRAVELILTKTGQAVSSTDYQDLSEDLFRDRE